VKREPVNLRKAYKDIFLSCTAKMAGLSLQEAEGQPEEKREVFLGSVTTSGDQPFEIRCVAELPVYHRIVRGMSNGKDINEKMQQLYFCEYMNVVCGKIISRRNNERGEFLRISIPSVTYAEIYGNEKQNCSVAFEFTCEEGWMGIYFL